MKTKMIIPNAQDVPWQVTELMTRMGVEYYTIEDD